MNMFDFYKNIISSSIGIIVAETITLPVCTTKTISQTNNMNAIDSFKFIKNNNGLRGFYSSWSYAILSQLFSLTTKYSFYYLFKDKLIKLNGSETYLSNTIVGVVSGFVSNIFSHPFDYLKVQRQRGKKLCDIDFKVYRGFSKSLTKSVILTSTIFPIFDLYQKHMNIFLASCLTSITVTTFLHPIDFLKVRQISNLKLYQNKLGYYYTSYSLNLIRCLPHFVIMMNVTSYIKCNLKF